MHRARWFLELSLAAVIFSLPAGFQVQAGQTSRSGYRVLAPLTSGSLTIFPVIADSQSDTRMFITLDEGLRSGDVVVTEAGNVQPLMRRRPVPHRYDGAQVNTLLLVNNSKRPLLLLAGEIVTGGKQDRVIGKDRIVPSEGEPVDLNVFCVEPGRWTARAHTNANNFNAVGALAQPAVRAKAMAKKDQQEVWDSVRNSQAKATENVEVSAMGGPIGSSPAAPPTRELAQLRSTTSYAQVMDNKAVQKQLDEIIVPLQRNYQALLKDLRAKNAVGVVVAVNGQILWADIFASTELLEKYWPKLVRSYAAEAITQGGHAGKISESEAQAFVNRLDGTHETAETDPGVFRQAEITGTNYKIFQLTSLLPKTDYTVHIAKMYDEEVAGKLDRKFIPMQE